MWKAPAILSLASLAACTSVADQQGAVRERASYEFRCPPEHISVTWLQAGTYGAEGCRQRQIYEVQGTMVYKEGAAPNPVYVQRAPLHGSFGYYHYHR